MVTLIKRVLAAAIVIAAVAAPTAAYARVIEPSLGAEKFAVEPPISTPTHSQSTPTATPSSSFQWADAGIGAGTLLVLIGVGGAAAAVYRRRTHPLAS